MLLSFRVLRAELQKSFASYGKMDPFAVVEWLPAQGEPFEVAHTKVHWNGHMAPQWDHTCRGQPYGGRGLGDKVEVKVLEANVTTKSVFLGSATALVDDLLDGEIDADVSEIVGALHKLPLVNNGAKVGTVTVQVLLVPAQANGSAHEVLSHVAPDAFVSPVARIGVSGGTAPFFRLLLRRPAPGQSLEHYIGKDLGHAADEVSFYEEARALRQQPGACGLASLLDFTFEYGGIFTSKVEGAGKDSKAKELLVMRNLRDGYATLRLLDIKIGQKTAQAGWQGKSRMSALRQGLVDGLTNSSAEGFRLEGFDGPPKVLASMDPLLDIGGTGNAKVAKKALRIMLQRMHAPEVLMHFVDLHQGPADPGDANLPLTYSPCEVSEMVLHEAALRLAVLVLACRRSPVPQKWIGSSVALAFDSGALPSRDQPEAQIRMRTKVNIFDWGRSELNTMDKYGSMSDKDQADRMEFWRYYVGGVDRLAWEVARAYRHHFGNADRWDEVTFTVIDFDSASENDFMAIVKVPLSRTAEKTVKLRTSMAGTLSTSLGLRAAATLTYSIEWREYPVGSRLRGSWRVTVVRAGNLPRADMLMGGKADPFCEVTAVSSDGHCRFRQQTCVQHGNLEPEWHETLEIPVAASPDHLQAAIDCFAPGLVGDQLDAMFPPEPHRLGHEGRCCDEAIGVWRARLDSFAQVRKTVAFRAPLTVPANLASPGLSSAADGASWADLEPCGQAASLTAASPRLLKESVSATAAAPEGADTFTHLCPKELTQDPRSEQDAKKYCGSDCQCM